MAHIRVLADDAFEGRGAGYPGEARAADYIAGRFREIGLRPVVRGVDGTDGLIQTFRFHPRGPERPGQTLESRNVIGFLEGADPALRDEIVVLGAHHDGQGRDGQADTDRYPPPEPAAASGPTPPPDLIWNSADDNASSVAVLIEVARLVAGQGADGAGPPPSRRSILFVTFGADIAADPGILTVAASPPELQALGVASGAAALKVSSVIPASPADRAGLRPGDFVVALAGRPLAPDAGRETIKGAFQDSSDPLRLDVIRGERRMQIAVRPAPTTTPEGG